MAVPRDNQWALLLTQSHGLLGDQFYFSNMLRSFLPKNRFHKTNRDAVSSLAYWWLEWRPGPPAPPPLPWSQWLPPPFSSLVIPRISASAHDKMSHGKAKRSKRHERTDGEFRSHGASSAFCSLGSERRGGGAVGTSTGAGPNVHYVSRNMSAIYERVSRMRAFSESSQQTSLSSNPDFRHFSALLGLELVVDYVIHEGVVNPKTFS